MSIVTVGLLELLKAEENTLMRERKWGENIVKERQRQERCGKNDPHIWNYCQRVIDGYVEERDKALADLLEVRHQIKLYFENL